MSSQEVKIKPEVLLSLEFELASAALFMYITSTNPTYAHPPCRQQESLQLSEIWNRYISRN